MILTTTHCLFQGILGTMLILCVVLLFGSTGVDNHAFSFYPVMVATLGSRLILSLRGSLLRPAYNDGVKTIELDTLVTS
jgi:hypothetical protein